MPPPRRTAPSLAVFMDTCSVLLAKWSSPHHGEPTLWYRGHRDASWPLVPGEYRYAQLDSDDMRSEFALKARALLGESPANDWEWYFLMQHFGLPTRLLDWTTGSLVALHFALFGNAGSTDSAVWVLDPWSLNKWSSDSSDLVLTGGALRTDAIAKKYLKAPYTTIRLPAKPIAVVPPFNSPRITVQRGCFTVHGSKRSPLDDQFHGHLAKIIIPKAQIIEMRRQLRSLGVSEFTLFPDLDGLSRDIRAFEIERC